MPISVVDQIIELVLLGVEVSFQRKRGGGREKVMGGDEEQKEDVMMEEHREK